ncbi:hypothetical protein BH11PSE13_BH11PSE13_12490 [soil metagenome]
MTNHMKLAIPVLTVLAALTFGCRAQAQTIGTTNGLRQDAAANAVISPGALTVNTLPAYPVTSAAVDSTMHTNQAASAPPAFGVQGMGCSKPGSGATLQVVGAGGAIAVAGDLDPGCDIPRDINTMRMVDMPLEDQQRRACDKPEIAKASKVCKRLAEQAHAEAVLNGESVQPNASRKQPLPWQAGG